MNEPELENNDTLSASAVLRHIFLESLASSPTTVSSSSATLSSSLTSKDVSIDTCLEYLRSNVSHYFPNDALDKFRRLMEEVMTPNGRVNWQMFKEASRRWIAAIDSHYEDGNNNLNEKCNDETTDSPDDGTTADERDVFDDDKSFDGSEKLSEFIEWSIMPVNTMGNDTMNQFDKTDVSIKSPGQTDSAKATEVELRLRVRRIDEDNAWLRDELLRTEELAANYQRQYHSTCQKFRQISEKCSQLERENEEQKELLINMEKEEKQCQVTLQKADKECKALLDKLETHRQLIPSLKAKLDKLTNDKLDYIKQLTTCRTNLQEKEVVCDVLQEKINQLTELNTSLEEYYEKTIRHLQERNDDLKSENVKLQSRVSIGVASSLNLTSSVYLDSSSESAPGNGHQIPPQDSLYAELKASGFPLQDGRSDTRIGELEEELDWYNEEIHKATQQLDKIIHQLEREQKPHDQQRLDDASDDHMRYILILLDKITQLSDAVTEALRKPSTIESSCEVTADPLANCRTKELRILTFEDNLNTPITSGDDRAVSCDLPKVFFTIGPAAIEREQDTEILPRSIYTCSDRLNRRRWGRTFNPISEVTACGDVSINGNSSPSLHSNTELESKISLRSAVNGDDIPEVNDAVFANTHIVESLSGDLYPEISSSSHISLSPICVTPNMTERNLPRRKPSVFSRTYDVDKILETHILGECMTSSTPAPSRIDSFLAYPREQISASTTYRSNMNGSDSSDSFSQSKLQTSIEEESINYDGTSPVATKAPLVILAPPKLNLPSADRAKESDISGQQDSASLIEFSDSEVALTQRDPGKHKLIESSVLSYNDSINNHSNGDSRLEDAEVDSAAQRLCCGGDISAAMVNRSTAVTLEMSSREDSSDSSDSDPAVTCDDKARSDQRTGQEACVPLQDVTESVEESTHVSSENDSPSSMMDFNSKTFTYKSSDKREIVAAMKRSRSESESLGQDGYRCTCNVKKPKTNVSNSQELQLAVFPSLSDIQLQVSGIANLSDNEDLEGNNLAEDVLERKFLAFSLGLCTDRLTLSRRRAISLRQRDQTEHNLSDEVIKMQQNIQELAPLCFDSETIERIERARNQVEIIAQCAHKVSCAAETLGAIQQEHRISRAIHVADRYLRMLRIRCEKLVADLAETKRILVENNIVIDEHNGESGEELTAIRYRGLPTTNRTMTARRRASIATIFRPLGPGQDVTKDGVRQRNSVSGRVTIRRPSFSAESQRWESEKINRTESSNSVGELRQIFEQAESRRGSIEENNNVMRLQVNNCESDTAGSQALEVWPCGGDDAATAAETDQDSRQGSRRVSRLAFVSINCPITWRSLIWCILISFFIGFYIKDAVSSGPCLGAPFKWWSIEEILGRHVEVRNTAPRPI